MTAPPRPGKLPRHIAAIMDGNGRWAEQHGRSRIEGHQEGAKVVREITRECARLGVERLTLYAFSLENWQRPKIEVRYLMRLLRRYLVDERAEIMDNRIRFTAVGRLGDLPPAVVKEYETTRDMSRANPGMTLSLALSYGGRQEIVDAARAFAEDVARGRRRPDELDEATLQSYLYDPAMPAPDLLIRTGGEQRVSNFLLWQVSYTEFWFTQTCWPDFTVERLHEAIRDYGMRERRFGMVSAQVAAPTPNRLEGT